MVIDIINYKKYSRFNFEISVIEFEVDFYGAHGGSTW